MTDEKPFDVELCRRQGWKCEVRFDGIGGKPDRWCDAEYDGTTRDGLLKGKLSGIETYTGGPNDLRNLPVDPQVRAVELWQCKRPDAAPRIRAFTPGEGPTLWQAGYDLLGPIHLRGDVVLEIAAMGLAEKNLPVWVHDGWWIVGGRYNQPHDSWQAAVIAALEHGKGADRG